MPSVQVRNDNGGQGVARGCPRPRSTARLRPTHGHQLRDARVLGAARGVNGSSPGVFAATGLEGLEGVRRRRRPLHAGLFGKEPRHRRAAAEVDSVRRRVAQRLLRTLEHERVHGSELAQRQRQLLERVVGKVERAQQRQFGDAVGQLRERSR